MWEPAFFGVKPELIVKGGLINSAVNGDANGSIPTSEPQNIVKCTVNMAEILHIQQ